MKTRRRLGHRQTGANDGRHLRYDGRIPRHVGLVTLGLGAIGVVNICWSAVSERTA